MNAKSPVNKRQSAPTVFVVDDDEGVRDSLRFLLKSVGLATRTSGSAAEFLDSYDIDQPGCLVLDVRMPECPRARRSFDLPGRSAAFE